MVQSRKTHGNEIIKTNLGMVADGATKEKKTSNGMAENDTQIYKKGR